jgi:hypothetical protein
MVHMSRTYLTEKQMPHSFWYYAIKHSARMMNMIPGKYRNRLASPFMFVHGVHPDQRTWLPLFLICYFHHEKYSYAQCSTNQAHTLDGIMIGCSPSSNAILVYNPCNQRYYKPATKLIHIAYLLQFIPQSFTTAAYSFPFIVVTSPPSVNLIPPVLELKNQAQVMTTLLGLALLWTFHWIQPLPHITSSNLMRALKNWFLHSKCPLSFPTHMTQNPIHPTFSLLSYISTLKLHSNTKASFTKGISQNLLKGHIAPATNCMSTRSTPIGVFHYPTFHLIDTICALMEFS